MATPASAPDEVTSASDPAPPQGAGAQACLLALLVAWVPIALFLADNAKAVMDVGPLLAFGAGLSLGCVGVVWAVGWRRGRPAARRAAGACAVVVLSTFLYGRWLSTEPASGVRGTIGVVLWLVLTALLATLAARAMAVPAVRQFALITVALVLVLATVTTGSVAVARRGAVALEAPTYAWPAPPERTPNIYWFVLDQYGRTDQLRAITGYDNASFEEALRQRGFAVSETTNAAYPHTHLSLASTLLMTYPWTDASTLAPDANVRVYDEVGPVVRGDNPVVEALRDQGYSFIYAPAGVYDWGACDPTLADVCLTGSGGAPWAADPLRALLATTPFALVWGQGAHQTPAGVLDQLDAERAQATELEPFFVFAHILSPHEPIRYAPDCSLRSEWIQGSNLSGPERVDAYVNDVRCLNADLVAAIDRIVAADPDAVIIVQSDHGSKLTFDWSKRYDAWTDANLQERFGALNAMRLPEGCDADVEGAPLVDTFPIVLGCLAGRAPEPGEQRSFFTDYGDLSTLVEVSDRVR